MEHENAETAGDQTLKMWSVLGVWYEVDVPSPTGNDRKNPKRYREIGGAHPPSRPHAHLTR